MVNTHLPKLDATNVGFVVSTLTRSRLSKYLLATGNNPQQALRLYVLNSQVSAALMIDLHYIEVALRNKFDEELTKKFGPTWFHDQNFLALVDGRSRAILLKAQKDAARHHKGCAPLPGKVIAELTFGFWLQLTDSRLEHTLWVPCLHKAFASPTPPKRAAFNQQLEKLRQLRNRIAHHEPIFHMDLLDARLRILEVCKLLCPVTAAVMSKTSYVRRTMMGLSGYRSRRGL